MQGRYFYEPDEPAVRLVQDVARISPKLRELLEEHVAFNDELLPHVLFGDVTRLVQLSAEPDSSPAERLSEPELSTLMGFLESSMRERSPEVVDVIRASFRENLERNSPSYEVIKALMGPFLREGLSLFES